MPQQRRYNTLDTGLGRSLGDMSRLVSGVAFQDVARSAAFAQTTALQKAIRGFDFASMFPALDRMSRLMASLDLPVLAKPPLLQFDAITKALNRSVRPIAGDLTAFASLAAKSQQRLVGDLTAGLAPFAAGLQTMRSLELLDTLQLLSERLGEVQHDPAAADSVLERAGETAPALRPLLDWLRENQHFAQWGALVLMLIFFVTEQVQGVDEPTLRLPPGAVVLVPGSTTDTATVTVTRTPGE